MVRPRRPLPKVYLAGKISKSDWRHSVVPGLRDVIDVSDYEDVPFPSEALHVLSRARYMGPFFVSDDHGCAHGDKTHGNGPGGCMAAGHRPQAYKVKVAERCKMGISLSEHVFVWLDDLTAFGTLVEVGIAVGLGKSLWIYTPAGSADLSELWFASHVGAGGQTLTAPTPEAAIEDFLGKLEMRARPLVAL
jgi:hypothetical protein